jgi:hypothetical protein
MRLWLETYIEDATREGDSKVADPSPPPWRCAGAYRAAAVTG